MTVCPYDCNECITKCADRNIDKGEDIFAEDFYPPFEEDTIYDDFEDYEQLGLADCLPEDF